MFFNCFQQKDLPFSWKKTILTLLISAFVAMCLVFLITTQHPLRVGMEILTHPGILLWNFLPALLAVCLVYFITGRLFFSSALLQVVWILFAVSDKIKVSMRQEPLLPTDLTLIKEALTIVKTFPVYMLALIGIGAVAAIAILIFSFIRSEKQRPPVIARLVGILCVVLAALGLNSLVYDNKDLYDGYPVVENPYFQVNQYNTRGLVYSFFHQLNIMRLQAPEGYDKTQYDNLTSAPTVADGQPAPNIIMIMGEAYSDLSENEHISFEGYTDPMANYKELCAKENAVSGHIAVANFGGGTSNTEYDVLTGLPTRFLDTALPSYNFIHHEIDALPYRLSQIGYETASIHPGYAWFYNRQNVYPDLGFETCYFLEDSFDLASQGIGGYVNEEATMDKILSVFEETIQSSSAPVFSFTVTIQNHGPYEKKYGTLPQNFSTDVELTETETDLLTQYFYGMIDADREIGRLVDYAENSEEPIILVYFGDHLPGFSNGMESFDLLDYPKDANGTPEEQTAVYETPFVIWANDSAAAQCGFAENITEAALPENGIISSFYLGALTTELAGIEGLSPLYDMLNDMRKEYPVLSDMYHVDAQGNYVQELPEDMQKQLDTLIGWQYYILFDQVLPAANSEQ
ncbi:LTA synthase family protein [Anaerotignum sp.]|uniref:LTA synthase family protein n=1 Tax=Anaerotignum sp. TaxID=2039241 RepID=UPI002A91A8A4|nr:LTA synthase family protein [Anaerotignum sp.]MCI7658377.1 LTA synthase family protein [Clostridia bacterium]MDY5415680.1 LTA synthase family protein [Anaerotignum sp.]